jgi:protease-4
VGAVQEIYSEVLKCKTKGKKVVASLGDVAASGGYYIASAADLVVANPGTITGSIGVLMELGNLEGLLQKIGVRLEVIKKGQHKDIGSPARPITEEERRLLQASIDDAYAQFVDAVVQGRRMPHEKVIALADGRVFTGRQALQAGLVDELGNNQDALDSAIRLAHLSPNAAVLSDAPHSILEFLKNFSAFSGVGALKSLADQSFGAGLQYILQ